jgi:hypothetical protein
LHTSLKRADNPKPNINEITNEPNSVFIASPKRILIFVFILAIFIILFNYNCVKKIIFIILRSKKTSMAQDGTDISKLLSSSQDTHKNPAQPPTEDENITKILMKVNDKENNPHTVEQPMGPRPEFQAPQPRPQASMQQPVYYNQPQNTQQSGVINDPLPQSTVQHSIDRSIAETLERNNKEVRFMNEEDDDDMDELGRYSIPQDGAFSLTELIWQELKRPLIFSFLVILCLHPLTTQLIQKYLPIISSSEILMLSFKTVVATLLFYILNKLSLF